MKKLTAETQLDLSIAAKNEIKNNPRIRYGQALFNTLYKMMPELADSVRGTSNDPFYASNENDKRIINFFKAISE